MLHLVYKLFVKKIQLWLEDDKNAIKEGGYSGKFQKWNSESLGLIILMTKILVESSEIIQKVNFELICRLRTILEVNPDGFRKDRNKLCELTRGIL